MLARALELLARRVQCDPGALISYLEGRADLPYQIKERLKHETSDTSPLQFEVVSDPLETPGGKILEYMLHQTVQRLAILVDWFTPYGLKKTESGYCFVNKYEIPVTPEVEHPALLRHFARIDVAPFTGQPCAVESLLKVRERHDDIQDEGHALLEELEY